MIKRKIANKVEQGGTRSKLTFRTLGTRRTRFWYESDAISNFFFRPSCQPCSPEAANKLMNKLPFPIHYVLFYVVNKHANKANEQAGLNKARTRDLNKV